MRTIFRSILLLVEILAWYAFGRYVWYKDHPNRRWSERHHEHSQPCWYDARDTRKPPCPQCHVWHVPGHIPGAI